MFVSRYIQRRSLRSLQNAILRRYDIVNMISSGETTKVKNVGVPIFTATSNVWNCSGGVRWMSGKSMRSRVAMKMQNESSKTLREIRRSKKLKLKLMTDEERLIYNLRRALFKARFEQALESQKLNIKKIEQELRRKGINPDDPTARASIQRVASTFFNAIDKKEGSPYVFQEDIGNKLGLSSSIDQTHSTAEDSDQEELDRFIAQIEQAADDEWVAEEEAEKDEVGKIRYWNKEDIGSRFRRSGMMGSDESDDESRGRTSGWNKTYGRKIADDDGYDDVSEDDNELDNNDDRRGRSKYADSSMYKAPDRHPKYKTEKWKKGKSDSSRNFDPFLKGKIGTEGSGSDMLSDVEEPTWSSDDEGGQHSVLPSEYRSSSDDGEDYDKVATLGSSAEDAPGSRASRGVAISFRTSSQEQMKKNEE